MEISYTQIGRDGDVNLVFSQDEGSITQQQLASGALVEAGMATWLWIVLIVLVIGLLGGAGAFFFLEFEELDEIEEADLQQNVSEDPYAWAKAKQVPELPATNTNFACSTGAPSIWSSSKCCSAASSTRTITTSRMAMGCAIQSVGPRSKLPSTPVS